ncbi:MAG TPA: alpha/beta hydrolase, partial [Acidimicrobiales bacterium]|nr:alpha/beta hydrolase [Acidimicrobiales bacterium]
MAIDDKVRGAERRLFEEAGLDVETSFVDLPDTGARVRVLGVGVGQPLVLLHGVSVAAVEWTSVLGELAGYRIHAVDLPGHGLSGPVDYRRGEVRDHTLRFLDELFEALGLTSPPVVAHSLGAMFALWYAAARPRGIGSLVAVGDPAVAIPGVAVRMPLSLMTVPVLGRLMLRSPSSRPLYRRLFAMGNGGAAGAAAPDALLDALRFAARRPGNARTVAALMHAINGFRRPRPESVMDAEELARIATPTAFLWGTDDPYLAPGDARPWIGKVPEATLHELPAGHAPWLDDLAASVAVITRHLAATGFPPRAAGSSHPAA